MHSYHLKQRLKRAGLVNLIVILINWQITAPGIIKHYEHYCMIVCVGVKKNLTISVPIQTLLKSHIYKEEQSYTVLL